MSTLNKIKSKVINIDINELIQRSKIELKIKENTEGQTVDSEQLLYYAIYDTLLIILDVTHRQKVDESLYAIWVNMIKDYWYLNKYDNLLNPKEDEDEDEFSDSLEVSSIKEGDTQVNFSQKSNTTNINGTTYSTGTINFDENILREKYKKDLYRHRVMRWG